MTAGKFHEGMAPYLPKAQQEGDQERRKEAKTTPCLDSLPSLWPCERSCLAVWAGNAPALHRAGVCWITPASTSYPSALMWFWLSCTTSGQKEQVRLDKPAAEYLPWKLFISLF